MSWEQYATPFSEKIEGFEQARRTLSSSAYGNAVSRTGNPSNRRNSGQSCRSANKNPPVRGKGKGTDASLCEANVSGVHMIPVCLYPESVKCKLCGAVGHVTPACGRRKIAQMAQHHQILQSSSPSSSQAAQQLAIAYEGVLIFLLTVRQLGLCLLHLLPRLLHLRVRVLSTRPQISLILKCLCD